MIRLTTCEETAAPCAMAFTVRQLEDPCTSCLVFWLLILLLVAYCRGPFASPSVRRGSSGREISHGLLEAESVGKRCALRSYGEESEA